MARGRFLNVSIATDIKLNSLSLEAHWLYMMTIPHLDRDGLIIVDTYVLFGKVCPRRPELIGRIDELIAEWCAAGLVTTYTTPDGIVGFFHGFTKNQQGMTYSREGASTFDPPPGYKRTNSGLTHELVMSESGEGHAEVKYKDQYQVEVKAFVAPTAATPTPQQELFLAVCEAVGWDYKTLSQKDKGQVAQTLGILTKANYTVDDLRRFMVDVWFRDWRWEKHQQRPTLNQLRQEIGKLRAGIPVDISPPRKSKGTATLERLSSNLGVNT